MFDAHVIPAGLSDVDLETLHFFGVERVLAFPRTTLPRVDAVLEEFDNLKDQLERLKHAGLRAHGVFGVHPASLPRRGFRTLLQRLPEYLGASNTTLGPIGLLKGHPAEMTAFAEQLQLARRLQLKVVVTVPSVDRTAMVRAMLNVLRQSQLREADILIEGADGKTIRLIRECGYFAGLTLKPGFNTPESATTLVRRLGPERVVLCTGIGAGSYDLLSLARAHHLLEKSGLSEAVVRRVTQTNAERFCKRSGIL